MMQEWLPMKKMREIVCRQDEELSAQAGTIEDLMGRLKVAKDDQRAQEEKQTSNKDIVIAGLKTNVEALKLKHTLELEANKKTMAAEVKQLRDAQTNSRQKSKEMAVKVQELEREAVIMAEELRVAKESSQQEEGTAVKVQQLEGEVARMAEELRVARENSQQEVWCDKLEDSVLQDMFSQVAPPAGLADVMSEIDVHEQLAAAKEQLETVDYLYKLQLIRLMEDNRWADILRKTTSENGA
jgi:hypothetical protein